MEDKLLKLKVGDLRRNKQLQLQTEVDAVDAPKEDVLFIRGGINHSDLFFIDGSTPPDVS